MKKFFAFFFFLRRTKKNSKNSKTLSPVGAETASLATSSARIPTLLLRKKVATGAMDSATPKPSSLGSREQATATSEGSRPSDLKKAAASATWLGLRASSEGHRRTALASDEEEELALSFSFAPKPACSRRAESVADGALDVRNGKIPLQQAKNPVGGDDRADAGNRPEILRCFDQF